MDTNIDRLRYAALELLIRLSKRFGKKRASTIFLVNNLHHIVQVGGPITLAAAPHITVRNEPCSADEAPTECSAYMTLVRVHVVPNSSQAGKHCGYE